MFIVYIHLTIFVEQIHFYGHGSKAMDKAGGLPSWDLHSIG